MTSPLASLAVATMFRGDPRQLVQWLNLHLGAGAERIYVALDRMSPEAVAALPADPRVELHPIGADDWARLYPAHHHNVERRQVDAARWLMARAAEAGHAWCAFVDTDEVLDLARPWADIVGESPSASALKLPVREMWWREGADTTGPDAAFGADLAIRPSPERGGWVRTLGWRAQYFRNGVLGHDAGKTVYRLPLLPGDLGVHGPLSGPLAAGATATDDADARVLHFDSGSPETWNARWAARVAGTTNATGIGDHRYAQLCLFAREVRRTPADQRAFFDAFFSLPASVAEHLLDDGTAVRVSLADRLGAPLPVPAYDAETLTQVPTTERTTDVQVAMMCDENFVAPTYATLSSVLARLPATSSVRLVVLGDGLRPEHEQRFRTLERCGRDVEVAFHDVTRLLDRDLGREGHQRSRATYARVYLVDHLPEQRTLYLDGDVLATRDISELFTMDIGGACIAGVSDSAALRAAQDPTSVPAEQWAKLQTMTGGDLADYLNAGVMLLEVGHPDYREAALTARAHVALHGRMLLQHDQDALNAAFLGRKHRLPTTYNYMTQFWTSERSAADDLIPTKYADADASLIHFSGKVKPWVAAEDEFYNGLYRRIVREAERRLGVSCGFYFSRPVTAGAGWDADAWRSALSGRAERPGRHDRPPAPRRTGAASDLALVDLTETGLYVRFEAATHELLLTQGATVAIRSLDGRLRASVPVADFGPVRNDLRERVAAGVRRAPLALPADGPIRLVVELPDAPLARELAIVDRGATVAGEVLGLVDGRLTGWYADAAARPISLLIGGELVASRVERETDGRRGFSFRLAHLVRSGYGRPDDLVTVRLAGATTTLPGPRITVADVVADPAPSLARRIGRRMRSDGTSRR
ncbi:glycosyltransferase [Nocardioides montaniterrae]